MCVVLYKGSYLYNQPLESEKDNSPNVEFLKYILAILQNDVEWNWSGEAAVGHFGTRSRSSPLVTRTDHILTLEIIFLIV